MTGFSHIIAVGSEMIPDRGGLPGRMLSGLRKNQIVEAEIVRSISPREAELRIQGKTVSAHTYIPLKPGQKISLRVTHTGALPRFQVVEAGGGFLRLPPLSFSGFPHSCPYAALGKLLQNLKGSPEASFGGDTLLSIDRLLKAIAPDSGIADPVRAREIVQKGGLTWEHKLLKILDAPHPIFSRFIEGDLKGLALLLLQNAEKEGRGGMDDLHLFLEDIERLQLLNQQASKESGRYLIPIPVLFGRDLRFGQMRVDLGRRASETEEERLIRVSLLLEMSRLGHLQVDLSLLKGAITGLFSVQDDPTRRLIESQLPDLFERLQKTGFTIHDMRCRTAGREELSAASLADGLLEDHPGILSILV